MARKRKTVDDAPWPRGVWNVTEAEYNAAKSDDGQEAWQVVRYCSGWAFVGDMVKDWLTQHRAAADLSIDAKFDALRAALA